MNWLESVLNGCLARSCSNALDWDLVIGLRDGCVESSRWLKVMDILELMAIRLFERSGERTRLTPIQATIQFGNQPAVGNIFTKVVDKRILHLVS